MNSKDKFLDDINNTFNIYKTFIFATGSKRTKAVEWASSSIKNIRDTGASFVSDETLLHKTGWMTFIGFGLYCDLLNIINSSKITSFSQLASILKSLLSDINIYTNIGHCISLETKIEDTKSIRFARVDAIGNIYIFPSVAEELLAYIEEINDE